MSLGATHLPRPGAWTIFRRSVYARSYPRLVGLWRNPSWLVMEVAFPMVAIISMAYVYRGLHAPAQFVNYVVLGGAMLAFWQNVLWTMAAQFYWDKDGGNLELYTISPTSFIAILLGMAFGAIIMTSVRAVVIIVLGTVMFGVHWNVSALLPALGIFALTLAGLYGLGMLLASLFLFYGREAWNLSSAMQEPAIALSGSFYPVSKLGSIAGGIGSLLPLTLGLDAIRVLLFPGAPIFLPLGIEVLVLTALAIVFAVAAKATLNHVERLARREGRLIMKWN
ncbi:MAG: ABC transporter permease [Candidatus Dormibacteria bacterium]